MYWWHQAALTVSAGAAERFGFITTNSLKQTFNRRVVQAALENPAKPLSLVFAVADHPWVDGANGAAVRIAMTSAQAGEHTGRLLTVQNETPQDDGEVAVTLSESQGLLHADLRIGANVAAAKTLRANLNMSSPGVKLHGAGFIVTRDEAKQMGLGSVPGLEQHIREYRNGRDLTASPRDVMVIDLFGLSADDVRQRFPSVYQWVLERVKPERDAKGSTKDGAGYAKLWWVHGKPRQEMRKQLHGLKRYIATVETAKHRTFQLLDATVLPDNRLICIATTDKAVLGVLSSLIHDFWALAIGGTLEDRPVYNKTTCFETFPFPADDTGLTPELRERIRALAEQLDAHRKQRQAAHPDLTLTGMYNVLEKLRHGEALSAKDKTLHEQGLVSVLLTLHDELDAAVLAAYGWQDLGPAPCGQGDASTTARAAWTDALLQRLVDLNTRRAAEEATGTIRWLRPEYQNPAKPTQTAAHEQTTMDLQGAEMPDSTDDADAPTSAAKPLAQQAWPVTLPEQIKAVADLLSAAPSALDLDAIAAQFKGKGRWRERLPVILETLVAIGRVRYVGEEIWAND
jgi:hypothetical protein